RHVTFTFESPGRVKDVGRRNQPAARDEFIANTRGRTTLVSNPEGRTTQQRVAVRRGERGRTLVRHPVWQQLLWIVIVRDRGQPETINELLGGRRGCGARGDQRDEPFRRLVLDPGQDADRGVSKFSIQ